MNKCAQCGQSKTPVATNGIHILCLPCAEIGWRFLASGNIGRDLQQAKKQEAKAPLLKIRRELQGQLVEVQKRLNEIDQKFVTPEIVGENRTFSTRRSRLRTQRLRALLIVSGVTYCSVV